jgi:hypothetical protein
MGLTERQYSPLCHAALSESLHRRTAALDRAVILLNDVVEILAIIRFRSSYLLDLRSACGALKPGGCGTFNYLVFSKVIRSLAMQTANVSDAQRPS